MNVKKTNKKIFFVLQDLTVGGAEQLKLIVEKYINKSNYSTTYCCIKGIGTIGYEIIKRGGRVTSFNLSDKFYNLLVTYRLYIAVKKIKPDIIHSALFNANCHARLVGMLTGIPVIIEEHGMYTWKRWYHIAIDKLLERVTHKIIVPSNSVKDFIIKQEKINPNKIMVVYNCIDPDTLKSNITKKEAREKINISESDFVIGAIGNLRKEKGHSVLLQAFKKVVSRHNEAKLFIAGYGPLSEALKDLSKNLDIEKNVIFMGKVRNIADFLKSLDLFVMPSLSEGFGISLIEAIYMNVPCIASNVGGIKEIAIEFPSINLIKSNDPEVLSQAIINCILNKTKPDTLTSDYSNRKETFTPNFYVDALQKLYDEV